MTDPLTAFIAARIDDLKQAAVAATAYRAILAEHTEDADECRVCATYSPGVYDPWPCATVRALATIWATHPDYEAATVTDLEPYIAQLNLYVREFAEVTIPVNVDTLRLHRKDTEVDIAPSDIRIISPLPLHRKDPDEPDV